MAVDWRLNNLADPAGSFDQGYDRGRLLAGQGIIDNALAGDPARAPDAIRRVDPALAASLQDRQRQEQERADRARISGMAVDNPLAARDEALRGGYTDLASAMAGLDDQSRERARSGMLLMSNVAGTLRDRFQTPEQRRSAALHIIDQMGAQGGLDPASVARVRAAAEAMTWDDASIADLQNSVAPIMGANDVIEVNGRLINRRTGEVVYNNPLSDQYDQARIDALKAQEDQRSASADFTRRRPAGGAGRGGGGGGGGRGGGATYSDLPPGARVVR
jgi:hypothetical protein